MLVTCTHRIADHLPEVAQELVDYILRSHKTTHAQNDHIAQLAGIMKEIEDQYNEPLLAWWASLYRFYRKHAHETMQTKQLLTITQEQFLILDVIANFLQKSLSNTASANTMLLDLLIGKLGKYQCLENDERFFAIDPAARGAAMLGIKLVLCNLFIQRAKAVSEKFRKRMSLHFEIVR